jgi:hypothetical protein
MGAEQPAGTLFLGVTSEAGAVAVGLVSPGLLPSIGGSGVLAQVDFADGGCAEARGVSVLDEDANKVEDLVITGVDDNVLEWYYKNLGDYDKNGLVTISDLTPIGANFNASVPGTPGNPDKDSPVFPVDGDGNLLITIAELTPIGANFNDAVSEYRIKTGTSGSEPFSPTGQVVPFDSGSGPGQRKYSVQISAPVDQNFYVVVPANDSEEGPVSNAVQYISPEPPEPEVFPPTNVQVANVGGSLQVTWQAPLTGDAPTGYDLYHGDEAIDFPAETATLVDGSPFVTLSATLDNGDYSVDIDHYFALKSRLDTASLVSAFSNIAFYQAPVVEGCNPVTNATATHEGDQVHVEWDPPAGGVTPVSYKVNWQSSPEPGGAGGLPQTISHPDTEAFFGSTSFPPVNANESAYFRIVTWCDATGEEISAPIIIEYDP